jgi:hypothetical protein
MTISLRTLVVGFAFVLGAGACSGSSYTGSTRGAAGDTGSGGSDTGSGGSTSSSGGGTSTSFGCPELCERIVAQNCANEPGQAACEIWCAGFTPDPECQPMYDAFFSCAEGAEYECNDQGRVHVIGCDVQLGIGVGCTISGPEPTLQEPCTDYCTKVHEANCENSGTMSDCTFGCTVAGSEDLGCVTEWNNFLECSETATYTCNDAGDLLVQPCGGYGLIYGVCVLVYLDQQNTQP